MENQTKHWIAKGYALEVATIILEEDRAGDLDRETLLVEIENFALENIKDQDVWSDINPSISESQLGSALEAASIAQIRNTVSGMVEQGLLEASFNEEGEVVYSTTAKGQAYADMIEDGEITQDDFNKQVKEGKI